MPSVAALMMESESVRAQRSALLTLALCVGRMGRPTAICVWWRLQLASKAWWSRLSRLESVRVSELGIYLAFLPKVHNPFSRILSYYHSDHWFIWPFIFYEWSRSIQSYSQTQNHIVQWDNRTAFKYSVLCSFYLNGYKLRFNWDI